MLRMTYKIEMLVQYNFRYIFMFAFTECFIVKSRITSCVIFTESLEVFYSQVHNRGRIFCMNTRTIIINVTETSD